MAATAAKWFLGVATALATALPFVYLPAARR
jgi:hypothetical protein